VVNRNCASFAELVEDGVDGLLCDTAPELASAIRHLLDNPGDGDRMGDAGREKVLRRYTWPTLAAEVSGRLLAAADRSAHALSAGNPL
jgi:glycosyltransferase involved in cell wall biosynthesis